MYWNLVESYFHGERGNGVVYRLRCESEIIISECLIPNSLTSPCIFSILFQKTFSNGIDKEHLVKKPRSRFFNWPPFDLFFMHLMFDSKGAIARKFEVGNLGVKKVY